MATTVGIKDRNRFARCFRVEKLGRGVVANYFRELGLLRVGADDFGHPLELSSNNFRSRTRQSSEQSRKNRSLATPATVKYGSYFWTVSSTETYFSKNKRHWNQPMPF